MSEIFTYSYRVSFHFLAKQCTAVGQRDQKTMLMQLIVYPEFYRFIF